MGCPSINDFATSTFAAKPTAGKLTAISYKRYPRKNNQEAISRPCNLLKMLKMQLQLSSHNGNLPPRPLRQQPKLAYHHREQQQKQKQVLQGRSPALLPVMLLLLMATLLTRPLSAFSNSK